MGSQVHYLLTVVDLPLAAHKPTLVFNNGRAQVQVFAQNDAPTALPDFSVSLDSVLNAAVSNDTLSADGSNSWTVVSNSGPANGTLNLFTSGTFSYTPDIDFSGTDSFSYQLSDVDGDAAISTVTITVNAVNDAPVLTDAGDVLSFIEDSAAAVIDGSLTLNDVDDTDLASATVQITSGFIATEDVLGFTDANGITHTWDSGTGGNASGTSSVTNYGAALELITKIRTPSILVMGRGLLLGR